MGGPDRPSSSSHSELCPWFSIAPTIIVLTNYTGLFAGADRNLHHPRSAFLRHEHEPGQNVRICFRTDVWSGLWIYSDCAAARNVGCSRILSVAEGTAAVKCCKLHHNSDKRCIFCGANGGFAILTANRYDVIIIGTGAGGGTLAHHLAPSGKTILILERGDYVPREKDNWNPQAVNVDAKYNTKESWRDKNGKDLHPHTNYYVGGNTKFYGAALFRRVKKISRAPPSRSESRLHGRSAYEELEPYYTQAEHLYQVHGNRGEDPTEPTTSADYRFPAMSHEPRIQNLTDDFPVVD